MAFILLIIGVGALWSLVVFFNKLKTTDRLTLVALTILCFSIPFMNNITPTNIIPKTVISNVYGDLEFSKVMKIEYELHQYPFWTWNAISSYKRNVLISPYEE